MGNLFRRVLKLIREEHISCLEGRQEEGGDGVESLARLVNPEKSLTPQTSTFSRCGYYYIPINIFENWNVTFLSIFKVVEMICVHIA